MLHVTNWQQLRIGRNDRASVIGATGTGKTTLVRFLVEDPGKRSSVTYDAKPSDAVGEWAGIPPFDNPRKLVIKTQTLYEDFDGLQSAEENRLIYRPSLAESLDPRAQDGFFEWVYWRRWTRLCIDEATTLKGGTNPSLYLLGCLARGRERGVSVVVCSQRPRRVPLVLFSESEHFFIFRLNLLEDRVRVYELTGIDPMAQADLGQHEFFYYNALLGEASDRLILDPAVVTPRRGLYLVRSQHDARSATSTTSIPLQHEAA